MKKLHLLYTLAAAAFLFAACDTDVEHDIAMLRYSYRQLLKREAP